MTPTGGAVPHAAPFTLRDGQVLSLGMPSSGLRTYVSFRGGLALPDVLGSVASDTMSGLGPEPVRAGQSIEIGCRTERLPHVDVAGVATPSAGPVELAVLPGPRMDWFSHPEQLAATEWSVSGRSDRKGIRLDGEPIERHRTGMTRSSRARAWSAERSRCPPTGSRCSSSTTTP